MLSLSLWSSAPIAVLLIVLFMRFRRRNVVAMLQGPPSSSWLVGNMPDISRVENVGDKEFKWVEKYGPVFKFKGAFGEDVLHVADPKAMQYILNSGYNFHKTKADVAIMRLFNGKGIPSVEGSEHGRHRKIMNPAFTYPAVKELQPIFSRLAQKASNKWKDIMNETGKELMVIDIAVWVPRLALDIIGEAVLDYKFDALDNEDSELSNVYRNILVDTLHNPSDADIVFQALWAYVPAWSFHLIPFIPLPGMKRIRDFVKISFRVARQLVDEEVAAISDGKPPGKDAMSLLVRANTGENPKGKLSDYELLSEMSTLLLAGHESTGSTMIWFLYELSRRPEWQQKIREEARAVRSRRGDGSLSIADLDSMTFTLAALKETLRFHPTASFMNRVATHDDEIPLSIPHLTVTGKPFTSIPVRKGQEFRVCISSYNRLKEVWGDDAHEWRPERFIEGVEQKTSVGLYSNLASFGAGPHGCVGWRFGIIEIQSVIIELLSTFIFTPAPENLEIIRAPGVTMTPMVRGQVERGAQLPLQVRLL